MYVYYMYMYLDLYMETMLVSQDLDAVLFENVYVLFYKLLTGEH